MNETEFMRAVIDRLIADGIADVEKTYAEGDPKRAGAIEGFELCRSLTTPAEYERVLKARRKREFALQSRYYDESAEGNAAVLADYWRHRYATLQLEFVFERLKVMHGYPVVSGNAVEQLSRILPEIDSENG